MTANGDTIDICTIEKNARERLKISLSTYGEHHLVNVRVWVPKDDTEIPTKSGVSLRIDQLGRLREALDLAEQEARRLGWLDNRGRP